MFSYGLGLGSKANGFVSRVTLTFMHKFLKIMNVIVTKALPVCSLVLHILYLYGLSQLSSFCHFINTMPCSVHLACSLGCNLLKITAT